MRFALSIPQIVPDGTFDPARLRDYLVKAETLGFQSIWTQEALLGSAPLLSSLELLAFACSCTQRLRLGCAVLVSPLHHPVHLAHRLSTLDQLSRGRLDVGLALGGRGRRPSVFGVDPAHLAGRFVEGLQLMQQCWQESRVTFAGRFWQLDDVAVAARPFQKPYPPIWIGGSHPAAVRRAVRYGSGFFGAGATTTADFARQLQVARTELARLGRADTHFQIAKRVYIAVSAERTHTRERLNTVLTQLYGSAGLPATPDLTALAIYGPPEVCIKGLCAVARAGAELIQLNPLFDESEQMERLARDVLPYVRAADPDL
ncbi:MAG TPA: LLM class flavin-dependent oxidoreductase [Ktedonobacteraceae bacterium]|jgi:alkanesulfonate monooxygenase SsuD/methylene tetrahydromethanopterin reductase-like flavin-dependent oxidoreductase (luciferase family)